MQNEVDRYLKMLGKRIKTERVNKKIPLYILAEKSHLSRNYISEIEQGKRNVTVATIYRIATALNIHLNVLLFEVVS